MSDMSAKVEMGRPSDFTSLPEISQHEIGIRAAGNRAVQLGVDNPAAGLDRGVVAEIVGGFQHEPCGVDRGLLRSRSACVSGGESGLLVRLLVLRTAVPN